MKEIFSGVKDSLFQEIVNNPKQYRLQVIYTQINYDAANRPSFKNYYFNYDPEAYFNPASMVKLPLAVLTLEKLRDIGKVHKDSWVVFDSSKTWMHPLYTDTTKKDGRPTLAHLIKRALLISENDPYNRMYQFLGQEQINKRLHQMGYKEARITRQFLGLTEEQNRHANPVRFLDKEGKTLYSQPATINKDSFDFSKKIFLGKAHYNRADSLIQAPFDFTRQNNIALGSLQQILQSVMFPASVPMKKNFRLGHDDYSFLLRYLSQYPSETPDPKYDTAAFYDSYVKFFFRNSSKKMPEGVRVFNKVGWSYGFLTDVSYVVDFNQRTDYMLSVTVYVNKDEILNDGRYEYATMGWPFLYTLGQAIYQYDRNRARKYKPDLDRVRIDYEQRDPGDKRKPLVDVDN